MSLVSIIMFNTMDDMNLGPIAIRRFPSLTKVLEPAIKVRTDILGYSVLPMVDYDWMYSVDGDVKEVIPGNAPEQLGKEVLTMIYVDANLYHDMVTCCSVIGILRLLNGTAIDWFLKHQATVETATFGSEFVAAHIAIDQIIDLRTTLHYMGAPIHKKSYMFNDNESVVTSSNIPESGLDKCHNAKAIGAKILTPHIAEKMNPADILSKHCGHSQAWPLIEPLLFCDGDDVCDDKEELGEDGTLAQMQPIRNEGECQSSKKSTPSVSCTDTSSSHGMPVTRGHDCDMDNASTSRKLRMNSRGKNARLVSPMIV